MSTLTSTFATAFPGQVANLITTGRVVLLFLLSVTFSFSAQRKKADLTKNFGIGLQGAPTFGGISSRYNGLASVYLQTVGRFILNGQDSDHMLGAGVYAGGIHAYF